MPINPEAVGSVGESGTFSWDHRDVILYALGVGAGAVDPLKELELTTENSHEVTLRVLPTFAVLAGQRAPQPAELGEFDRSGLLHAGQSVELNTDLPIEGCAVVSREVTGIWDKGWGALVESVVTGTDPDRDERLFQTTTSHFIRGEGGWGGPRGSSSRVGIPERGPDRTARFDTAVDQALLYRLSGDRNPLHSDPQFAQRAGFSRPILHGLCTFGIAGRLIFGTLLDSRPGSIGHISARFSKPVYPGDSLEVRMWNEGDELIFSVVGAEGDVVLDSGICRPQA